MRRLTSRIVGGVAMVGAALAMVLSATAPASATPSTTETPRVHVFQCVGLNSPSEAYGCEPESSPVYIPDPFIILTPKNLPVLCLSGWQVWDYIRGNECRFLR